MERFDSKIVSDWRFEQDRELDFAQIYHPQPQPTSRPNGRDADRKSVTALAKEVLNVVIRKRRMERSEESCRSLTCPICSAPHLPKVATAMVKGEPIQFVLPAFPGKSPNLAKVLGPLPDMAEKQSLHFLNELCRKMGELYEPGAKILICSDGRVFNDLVEISDENITSYQKSLNQQIQELQLENISTFNLDDVGDTLIDDSSGSFAQLRQSLVAKYAQPLEALQERIRSAGRDIHGSEAQEAQRMYCGITRFLFEDALVPGQTRSRTSIQKSCRLRAYEVIRRSNAWSELIAENFPESIRLSIHPQSCGSRKLGIQLVGTNAWLTPWHGVAVQTRQGFTLMKRWEAESRNAHLVMDAEGKPSHYQLLDDNNDIYKGDDNEIKL